MDPPPPPGTGTMCRFVHYLGRPLRVGALLTEPENSLIHQSFEAREREEPLNGDGFGLAWYVDGEAEPARFRSVTPAWSNANLRELARVTRSSCVLAHVRAATQGAEASEANCHPFKAGRLSFMHNGDLGGFGRIRRALLDELSEEAFAGVRGSTDSEHLFALVLDELAGEEEPDGFALAAALERAMARALAMVAALAPGEPSYLNLVLSDGRRSVACRYATGPPEDAPSLYLSRGRRYACEGGACRMLDPEEGHGAILIASEPLSPDPGWEPVPAGHLLVATVDLEVTVRPLELRA